jgi:hypothetical protein
LAISHVSPEFGCREHDVEFCAGLARRGDVLFASLGFWVRAAVLALVRLDEVMATLVSVMADDAAAAVRSLGMRRRRLRSSVLASLPSRSKMKRPDPGWSRSR